MSNDRSAPVLVLGVTGKTGAAVARALLARGVAVRGVSRGAGDGGRAGARPMQDQPGTGAPAGVQVAIADPVTGVGMAEAVRGCRAVYHLAPNLSADEVPMLEHTIAACRSGGVRRVVFHSVMHPWAPSMAHHVRKAEAEDVLRRSGLAWTVLQPAAYHQNLLGGLREGVLSAPYSTGRPFTNVDLRDVAEAAAIVLGDDAHVYGTYELAGPERLDLVAMAEQAARVLGRPVVARRGTAPTSADPRETAELAAMFDHYDHHGFTGSPFVLRALLGRRPRSWAQFLFDTAAEGK
ncbi:SDR family oxidoreductase [Propionibacteriaceae bacterium G1746]